jgi:hypothetical protein
MFADPRTPDGQTNTLEISRIAAGKLDGDSVGRYAKWYLR